MTISIWWLVAIAPLSGCLGFLLASLFCMSKRADEHINLLAQQMREEEANEEREVS